MEKETANNGCFQIFQRQIQRQQQISLMKYKWPTLEGRLNQPLTSRLEALKQLKACGGVTLSPWAEKELERLLKKEEAKKLKDEKSKRNSKGN
jgi:hypothetical protein